MTAWQKGFAKTGGIKDKLTSMLGRGLRLKGTAVTSAGRSAAEAGAAAPKAVGGYAKFQPDLVNQDFNVSGFQRGTKIPTKISK